MGEKRERRGELTSATIIPIILLIAGFAVLLYVGYQLFFADDGGDLNTQRQICQLSVLTRATANERLKAITPLKCTTEKICISNAGTGECKDSFGGEEGIQEFQLKQEKGTAQSKALEIDYITAEAMYNCWNMMGQGKLDIFGGYASSLGLTPKQPTCVICSRIAVEGFSEEQVKQINGWTERDAAGNFVAEHPGLLDLSGFLQNNLAPQSSKTYMEVFTDKDVRSYPKFDKVEGDAKNNKDKIDAEIKGITNPPKVENYKFDEVAVVFMQIKTNGYLDTFKNILNDGTAVAAGAFLIPGSGLVARTAGRVIFSNWVTASLFGVAVAGAAGYVAYNVKEGRAAATGYCGEFTTSDKAAEDKNGGKEGCSIIQVMPYSVKQINAFCKGGIQGMP